MSEDVNLSDQKEETKTPTTFDDLLGVIKNDNGEKKYSSIEEALKGAAHGQDMIRTLKEEAEEKNKLLEEREKQMRERAERLQVLEEATASLESYKAKNTMQVNQPTSDVDINTIVAQQLEALEVRKTKESNLNTVMESLKSEYGERASEVLQASMKEMGMTQAQTVALASENPKAFIRLFAGKAQGTATQNKSSIRTEGLDIQTQTPVKKNKPHTTKEMVEVLREVKSRVHAKLGVETQGN